DKEKVGLDFKFQPNPATSIIVTANPDFAQIESDYDIINVSDSPTEFPERRPFFTTNNEFYNTSPGVRTRNVNEIDIGVKLVQEIGKLKYDVTGILEKNNDKWLMGDFIFTNSTDYRFELIGGLLERDKTVFNSVFSTSIYALDRTLTFFSHFEVNNEVTTHVGTLSGISYRTRNWSGQVYVDAKPEGYNTGIVGYYLQSNKLNLGGYLVRNWFFDDNFIRRTNFRINYDRFAIHSNTDESWSQFQFSSNTEIDFGPTLGLWYAYVQLTPDTHQKFRNRYNIISPTVYYDNHPFSAFDLQDQGSPWWYFFVRTDGGRDLSFIFEFDNNPIRQSQSNYFSITTVYKPIPELRIDYSFSSINLDGSKFQNALKQNIHRIKAEYNITDRLNLRTIYNFNKLKLPDYIDYDEMDMPTSLTGYEYNEPAFNITSAWEYEPGSFAYLVFNQFSNEDRVGSNPFVRNEKYNQFIIKFSKNFQF
ncbi:MAG: hypothetical protein KDD94_11290, partial [Calditrichaeota bacterium]|nr:hypothetical protein [Calditrichota bacterium]